jgi:SAM-dependent methyltransferase
LTRTPQLDIDLSALCPAGLTDQLWGRHAFIAHNAALEAELARRFGRGGLCLKVFPKSGGMERDEYRWGSRDFMPTFDETTKAQNLLAWHGLAPRVYEVAALPDGTLAQVTDFVQDNARKKRGAVAEAMEFCGIVSDRHPKTGSQPSDWRGGLLVDCCGLRFADVDAYLNGLRDRASGTLWGRPGDRGYQGAAEIGLEGRRTFVRRLGWMRLDEVDFQGKTVLDLGCNLGNFCREAARRGAARVVGVDLPDTAAAAFEIANWAELWNVDFLGLNLPEEAAEIRRLSGVDAFDIVFLLATVRHIGGWADWINDLCADVLYLEGHSVDEVDTYAAALAADFATVKYMGTTKDHFPRPLLRCRK